MFLCHLLLPPPPLSVQAPTHSRHTNRPSPPAHLAAAAPSSQTGTQQALSEPAQAAPVQRRSSRSRTKDSCTTAVTAHSCATRFARCCRPLCPNCRLLAAAAATHSCCRRYACCRCLSSSTSSTSTNQAGCQAPSAPARVHTPWQQQCASILASSSNNRQHPHCRQQMGPAAAAAAAACGCSQASWLRVWLTGSTDWQLLHSLRSCSQQQPARDT